MEKDINKKEETGLVKAEFLPMMVEKLLAQSPKEMIEEGRQKARLLVQIVKQKKKPVIIRGEHFLEFEDWQTLAKFYGLTVKTGDAVPVEVNGIKGAKAKATVNVLGVEIGGAEAYCLYDEKNWEDKPFFQLASMAQTRAGAKSLRNILAWVVVLAGFKPTPAEEMENFREEPSQKRSSVDATLVPEQQGDLF